MDPISLIIIGTLGAIGYKLFKKEPEEPNSDNNNNSSSKENQSSVLDFFDTIHPINQSLLKKYFTSNDVEKIAEQTTYL